MKTLYILRNRVVQITLASDLVRTTYPDATPVEVADNYVTSVGATYVLAPTARPASDEDRLNWSTTTVSREALHSLNLRLTLGQRILDCPAAVIVDGTSYELNSANPRQFVATVTDPRGLGMKPRFLVQPTAQVVPVGAKVQFQAIALAATSYQWTKNGANIAGATGTVLEITSAAETDSNAAYACVATNALGATTSDTAVLSVGAAGAVAPTPTPITGLQFSRRQGSPASALTNTSSFTQFNSSSTINNQLGVAVNKIRLKWVNAIVHFSNGTMIPGPRIARFRVGISPAGNTAGARTSLLFGGLAEVSVEPGAEVVCDVHTFAADLAAGASARVVVFAEYESAPARLPNSNINSSDNTNELNEGGTGALAPKDLVGMPASRIGAKVILPPVFALGVPVGTPTVTKRIGFIGDSITSGADDTTTGSTIGFAQRGAHAANVPWVASSTEGLSHVLAPAGSDARRFLLSPFQGCTHVFDFLGVNDIRAGQTAAALWANKMSVKAELNALGIKYIPSTIWPNTNAGNTAEASAGIWDRLNAINTLIRDNNGGGDGFFELNALVRDGANPNLWGAPGGGADGTHPGTTHHTTVATAFTAYIGALS